MAKLKCREHKRRVMVLQVDDSDRAVHREDGSACIGSLLQLGEEIFEPWEIELQGVGKYVALRNKEISEGHLQLGEPGSGARWGRVLGNDETHE